MPTASRHERAHCPWLWCFGTAAPSPMSSPPAAARRRTNPEGGAFGGEGPQGGHGGEAFPDKGSGLPDRFWTFNGGSTGDGQSSPISSPSSSPLSSGLSAGRLRMSWHACSMQSEAHTIASVTMSSPNGSPSRLHHDAIGGCSPPVDSAKANVVPDPSAFAKRQTPSAAQCSQRVLSTLLHTRRFPNLICGSKKYVVFSSASSLGGGSMWFHAHVIQLCFAWSGIAFTRASSSWCQSAATSSPKPLWCGKRALLETHFSNAPSISRGRTRVPTAKTWAHS
jgi:hypothetical protein